MATRIKYCGITRLEDAEHAVSLDAWAVGLILWPGSGRYCRPADAAAIGAALHRRAEVAGVFVNAHLDHVVARAEEIGLTLVQLHGDEGPSFCTEVARRTGAKVIKVARVRNRADVVALRAFRTDYHLLDAYVAGRPGGTGETFAWDLVNVHRRDRPVILSGGLTPDNVGDAIAAAHPYAVDVASGVERAPGIKDHARMDAFSAAVRAADAREQQGAAA
ncbi:phosphoribosylanthranilate isomerase [Conexibacter arvalis]|uniref:N-(5'-phosphoribosyl)anthranilate isomerase n=1 Tax=Conexibacter arvalis TaxID=912552 RepID=A0A840IIE2_9ACTN|nr:phosphoribosylanthranilate isomerase [Conexibacter arvalis]MBB4663981.1 phosphoribosylanthranilate isomerase [Conexibacter arvalis]